MAEYKEVFLTYDVGNGYFSEARGDVLEASITETGVED